MSACAHFEHHAQLSPPLSHSIARGYHGKRRGKFVEKASENFSSVVLIFINIVIIKIAHFERRPDAAFSLIAIHTHTYTQHYHYQPALNSNSNGRHRNDTNNKTKSDSIHEKERSYNEERVILNLMYVFALFKSTSTTTHCAFHLHQQR